MARKEKKYDTWEKVEKILRDNFGDLINDGLMPTQSMFAAKKIKGLLNHWKLSFIAEKLNCDLLYESDQWHRRSKYKDPDYIISLFKDNFPEHIQKGILPTEHEVRDKGFWSVETHWRWWEIAKLLNCRPQKNMEIDNKEYWKDWNNIKSSLMENFGGMIEQGIFPSIRMIKKSGLRGIQRYSGITMQEIADKLNCNIINKWIASDGHKVDSYYELVVDEYLCSRGIEHFPGVKIDEKHKCDQKLTDNAFVEIWGYSNSKSSKRSKNYNKRRLRKEKIYKDLNLTLISIDGNQLERKTTESCELYLNGIFSNYGFDINPIKPFDISNFSTYKWTFDRVEDEVGAIAKEIGYMPSGNQLKDLGKSILSKKMQQFGGKNLFCESLGVVCKNKHSMGTKQVI